MRSAIPMRMTLGSLENIRIVSSRIDKGFSEFMATYDIRARMWLGLKSGRP
jgi:hypothetical protein